MTTLTGTMSTTRPERYAKQLVGHWAKRGPVTFEDGATVQRWEAGRTLMLRPVEGSLEVEVTVPDGEDVAGFARAVKEHLERFGTKEELDLVWHA